VKATKKRLCRPNLISSNKAGAVPVWVGGVFVTAVFSVIVAFIASSLDIQNGPLLN
jgi:hypothetical protein